MEEFGRVSKLGRELGGRNRRENGDVTRGEDLVFTGKVEICRDQLVGLLRAESRAVIPMTAPIESPG